MDASPDRHTVLSLWTRSLRGQPTVPHTALTLVAGQGVEGDHGLGGKRHVTILFEDDWNAAAAELGRAVDPAGRRANVMVSGGNDGRWVGRTVQLGEACIEVLGITRPCEIMEEAAVGMVAALEPRGRGGVWGRIVEGGQVRIADSLADGRRRVRPDD